MIAALKRRYQSPDGTVTVGEVIWRKKEEEKQPESLALTDWTGVELHLFVTDPSFALSVAEKKGWQVHVLPEPPKKRRALRAFRKALHTTKFDVIRCRDEAYAPMFLQEARKAEVEVRIAPVDILHCPEDKVLERSEEIKRYATIVNVPVDPASDAAESGDFYRSLIKGAKK